MKALFRRDPLGIATALIAVCAIGAALLVSRSETVSTPSAAPAPRPASGELARCRSLGEAGGADPRCQAAWAESRRRFFGTDDRP